MKKEIPSSFSLPLFRLLSDIISGSCRSNLKVHFIVMEDVNLYPKVKYLAKQKAVLSLELCAHFEYSA